VSRNERGLTLVEVMVALVLFLFVFLALMQTALVSIESNMNAALREEAVKIAEERMNDARGRAFNSTYDTLTGAAGATDTGALTAANCPSAAFRAAHPNGRSVQRNIRSIQNFPFCTSLTVQYTVDNPYATVNISIGWQWKGNDYTHNVSTLIKKVMLG